MQTQSSTYANRHNLAPAFLAEILATYEGTRLGRQEIHGEILDDVPGALWHHARLDELRVTEAPGQLARVVVAVDPAVSSGETADETGIVVCCRDAEKHAYVLADLSGRYAPIEWAEKVAGAYRRYEADAVVAEVNQGGALVTDMLRLVDDALKVVEVRATRGKYSALSPWPASMSRDVCTMSAVTLALRTRCVPSRSTWTAPRRALPTASMRSSGASLTCLSRTASFARRASPPRSWGAGAPSGPRPCEGTPSRGGAPSRHPAARSNAPRADGMPTSLWRRGICGPASHDLGRLDPPDRRRFPRFYPADTSRIAEQRRQAVLEVMRGLPVSEVVRRYGVTRQSVHRWLRRYAGAGLEGLADRFSRAARCPHQMPPALEAPR